MSGEIKMQNIFSIILLGCVGYAVLVLIVWSRQDKYVFYPERKIGTTPSDSGLKYENFIVTTGDGERIAGWFIYTDNRKNESTPVLLCCHGNAGNIGDRVWEAEVISKLGFNVVLFDYRGYGESTGTPSEDGIYKDGLAVWEYLAKTKKIDGGNIIIYGKSLGTTVAIDLASRVKPAGLIVESGFTSARDMAKIMFPFLPFHLICKYEFNNMGKISKVNCPVLVAHSPDDEMIPFEHGKAIYSAANNPKFFVELSGGHNDGGLLATPEMTASLKNFVENVLQKKTEK